MQRYFLEDEIGLDQLVEVPQKSDIYHHLKRVMRAEIGTKVELVGSNDFAALAQVINITDDEIEFEILEQLENKTELPIKVTIACGFPKGDKLELITQKATELGAHEIIAFPADNSVVKWDDKKRAKLTTRLNKIAQEAAEQSHRNHKPLVEILIKESQLIEKFGKYDSVLYAYEEAAKVGEASEFAKTVNNLDNGDSLLIIFGPEGGISPNETKLYDTNNARPAGLGPRIMRCETAPLYALAAISFNKELA
jgi:16S rRNA (uracil1498-N3)-methyltransferase